MARAVLPIPSARAEWLFAGIIDRALHNWRHVPALDGGPGDHDLDDFETEQTPDDDDIDSPASYAHESVQPSSLQLPGLPPCGCQRRLFHAMSRTHPPIISTSRTASSSWQLVLDMLTLESDVCQRCLSAQPAPTAPQRFNRCNGALLLRDLAAPADLPLHSALFCQQLDLTHRWWS